MPDCRVVGSVRCSPCCPRNCGDWRSPFTVAVEYHDAQENIAQVVQDADLRRLHGTKALYVAVTSARPAACGNASSLMTTREYSTGGSVPFRLLWHQVDVWWPCDHFVFDPRATWRCALQRLPLCEQVWLNTSSKDRQAKAKCGRNQSHCIKPPRAAAAAKLIKCSHVYRMDHELRIGPERLPTPSSKHTAQTSGECSVSTL